MASKQNKWCITPGCSNTSLSTPSKLFVNVPKDKRIRKVWWNAVRRDPPINTGVCFCCEDHFKMEEDVENYMYFKAFGGNIRLKQGVVPHIFACQGRTPKDSVNRASLRRKRMVLGVIQEQDIPVMGLAKDADSSSSADAAEQPTTTEPPFKHAAIQARMSFRSYGVQVDVQSGQSTSTACQTDEHNESSNFAREVVDDPSRNEGAFNDAVSDSSHSDLGFDDDISPDFELGSDDSDEEGDAERKHSARRVTCQLIADNPMRYIGVPPPNMFVLDLLTEKVPFRQKRSGLTKKEAVMLVLYRIRTGMPNDIVADMFGVDKSVVSRLFARLVPAMADCLQGLVRWPHPDDIRRRLPHAFKAFYPSAQSIIDCFEIEVEKPSGAVTQSMSWSEYKKSNTVKYFISATPDGLINFVSVGKPGRCSDMELMRSSQYMNVVPSGATVLADRGFKEIEVDLNQKGCRLIRPASVRKDVKLSREDVLNMKTTAGLRIHIERVIRRVRVYRFLQMHARVPLSMVDRLDDVVVVVCGLVNLQERIIKV